MYPEEKRADEGKEKEEEHMDEDDLKTDGVKKTDAEEAQEQDLLLSATEDDIKFDDDTSDKGYVEVTKGGHRGFRRTEERRPGLVARSKPVSSVGWPESLLASRPRRHTAYCQ